MIGTLGFACPGMVYATVGRWQPVDLDKADAYSAGCTLYQLLTGLLPAPLSELARYSDYAAYYDILVSERHYPSKSSCPPRLSNLYVGLI